MIAISIVLCFVMIALTIICMWSDISTMTLPNKYVLPIAGLFILAFCFWPAAFSPLWMHIGAAVLILAITYLMFAFNMLGAGDAKYAAVLGLWVGFKGLMIYMFFMAVIGGLLGAASLLIRKYKPVAEPKQGSWIAIAQSGKSAVPYGIAITLGAWMALFHIGPLAIVLHELNNIISSN